MHKYTKSAYFCNKIVTMTIREWIRNREIRGQATFCIADVVNAFPSFSDDGIRIELARLIKGRLIMSPYRGFYVVIPPQYALKGNIPPSYYIDQLMEVLGKPYYVCLLTAAAMHGATHQRAMSTQVMTVLPRSRVSDRNRSLDWNYRSEIPSGLLYKINTETGTMLYSCPELTAVDLIQFASKIGGYQRAATVLSELCERLDIAKMKDVIPYTTMSSIRRLGFMLEFVLDEKGMSDELYAIAATKKKRVWNTLLFSNSHAKSEYCHPNRWNIDFNIDIEIDEL